MWWHQTRQQAGHVTRRQVGCRRQGTRQGKQSDTRAGVGDGARQARPGWETHQSRVAERYDLGNALTGDNAKGRGGDVCRLHKNGLGDVLAGSNAKVREELDDATGFGASFSRCAITTVVVELVSVGLQVERRHKGAMGNASGIDNGRLGWFGRRPRRQRQRRGIASRAMPVHRRWGQGSSLGTDVGLEMLGVG
ncbi:unnamed protein product [Ilex paraguariensis]|uniref:Uncharacterized protein n=1 Tax=Ilex paraguariensis TaxID=185542 RepID=A0ABC8QP10_9AQUA